MQRACPEPVEACPEHGRRGKGDGGMVETAAGHRRRRSGARRQQIALGASPPGDDGREDGARTHGASPEQRRSGAAGEEGHEHRAGGESERQLLRHVQDQVADEAVAGVHPVVVPDELAVVLADVEAVKAAPLARGPEGPAEAGLLAPTRQVVELELFDERVTEEVVERS